MLLTKNVPNYKLYVHCMTNNLPLGVFSEEKWFILIIWVDAALTIYRMLIGFKTNHPKVNFLNILKIANKVNY